MTKQDINNHIDKLSDESKLQGKATSIYFPKTKEELVFVVNDLVKRNLTFTIQGGRTSITGSSVSYSENIINIENINTNIELVKGEKYSVICDCGVRLSELNDYIKINAPMYQFSPNPTEPTATISGLISTNAKGTNNIKYGSILDKLLRIKVLLLNGKIIDINKGDYLINKDNFTLPNGEILTDLKKQNLYSGPLGICQNKDLLSIFAGSEGILGVILEAELLLDKKVENKYGVFFFFSNDNAKDFACEVKKYLQNNGDSLCGLEYFDKNSLDILKDYKAKTTKLKMLPDFNATSKAAIYVELENNDMDELESNLFYLLEQFANFGGDENDTWAGVGEEEIEKFSILRHSLPEAINIIVEQNKKIVPSLTKIALDYKLDTNFDKLFDMYNDLLSKSNISYAIFGHIGDNHLHINLMPKSVEEINMANDIVNTLASFVSSNNGCLAYENGVGKLKNTLIKQYNNDLVDNAIKIKKYFDNNNLLNPHNMIGD